MNLALAVVSHVFKSKKSYSLSGVVSSHNLVIKMKNLSLFLFLCVLSAGSQGKIFLQKGGSITYVAPTHADFPADESFFIKVSNNFGACTAGSWIWIRKQDFGTNTIGYQALYSTALAAYMSGATNVTVYNGFDNDCLKATFIAIER